jgi:hypothetical protein
LNRNVFELEQLMKQRQREIEKAGKEAWKFFEKDRREVETNRGSRIKMKLLLSLVIQLIKR